MNLAGNSQRDQTMELDSGLLRILFRGMVIDAKARESRIIDIVVRADDQYSGFWRRLRQYLSNALYRAGDMLNPGNDNGLPRVIEAMVIEHTLDDGLSSSSHFYAVNRTPSHLANGEASYKTFTLYEGVENKKLEGKLTGRVDSKNLFELPDCIRDRLYKGTQDVHIWPDDILG